MPSPSFLQGTPAHDNGPSCQVCLRKVQSVSVFFSFFFFFFFGGGGGGEEFYP